MWYGTRMAAKREEAFSARRNGEHATCHTSASMLSTEKDDVFGFVNVFNI